MFGFPAVLGLLQSPLPRRTIPAAGSSIRLDPIFNPTLASSSGCPARSQFDLPSWKALDINSSVGRACGEFVTLKGKGKYRWKPLNPLGPSPVQRRKRKRPPFVVVLDNALTPRTLNIRCLSTPKTLFMSHQTSCPPVSRHRIENRCLVTSPCFPELPARTSTLSPRTTLMASIRYRSTSSVKQWCVDPFFHEDPRYRP